MTPLGVLLMFQECSNLALCNGESVDCRDCFLHRVETQQLLVPASVPLPVTATCDDWMGGLQPENTQEERGACGQAKRHTFLASWKDHFLRDLSRNFSKVSVNR